MAEGPSVLDGERIVQFGRLVLVYRFRHPSHTIRETGEAMSQHTATAGDRYD